MKRIKEGICIFQQTSKENRQTSITIGKKEQERNAVKVRQIKGFRSYVLHIGISSYQVLMMTTVERLRT